MAITLSKTANKAIAAAILFAIVSAVVLPFFSRAWRYCQAREWVGAQGGVLTNCTTPYQTANTTAVDPTAASHTEQGETSPVATDNTNADVWCLNCSTLGGYRGAMQGLLLVMFVVVMIVLGRMLFK